MLWVDSHTHRCPVQSVTGCMIAYQPEPLMLLGQMWSHFFSDELCFSAMNMDTQDWPQCETFSSVRVLLCDSISARASDAAWSNVDELMSSFFSDELCFSALNMDTQDWGVRSHHETFSSVSVLLCDSISARASDAAWSNVVALMSSFFSDELCFSAMNMDTQDWGVRPQPETFSSVSVLLCDNISAIAAPTPPSCGVGDGDKG